MKPTTLLIAESDAELCDLYQRFIATRGFAVETASDGLDCLAKLRRATPAAVVLDLELPWGGGSGVLAWLREERAASDVPVILTATAAHPADAGQCIAPPVIDFLPKPFPLTTLLDKVRTAVARGTQATAGQVPASTELYFG